MTHSYMQKQALSAVRCFFVLLVVPLAPATLCADLTFYADEATFQSSVSGMLFLGTEDFEEIDANAHPPSATGVGMVGPLSQTSTNSPYPNGINMPITVQANSLGGNPTVPSPRGSSENGLSAQQRGFRFVSTYQYRFTSAVVLANVGGDSIDYLLEPSDNIRGISLWPKALDPLDANVTIRVYSVDNTLLGSTTVLTNTGDVTNAGVDLSLNPFVGIVSDTRAIGRINLYGTRAVSGSNSVGEGADDISLYSAIPEPGSAMLLLSAAMCLAFRRRRG